MENALKPTILYVDDQASHRALFEKAFKAQYTILLASSGEEGLEIIKNNHVFLVIADHNMPGMTGVDFLEKTKEILPHSQSALLSAYLDDTIVKEAMTRIQLDGRLAKPWKLDNMRGFLQKAFEKYNLVMPISEPALPADLPELPLPVPAPVSDLVPPEPLFSVEQISQLYSLINQESLEPRSARRVLLNFVEPKIKPFIPLIKRPIAASLNLAQGEALKGNIEGLEKHLIQYLQELSVQRMLEEPDAPQKTSH